MKGRDLDKVIESLTTEFYSHLHAINRHEARDILGTEHVEFASGALSSLLDELLQEYENNFALRRSFFLRAYMGDNAEKKALFAGGAVESKACSYLFYTEVSIRQHSALPQNVQVQLPPGQEMPLIAGLPREFAVDVASQGWERNTAPRGVTL